MKLRLSENSASDSMSQCPLASLKRREQSSVHHAHTALPRSAKFHYSSGEQVYVLLAANGKYPFARASAFAAVALSDSPRPCLPRISSCGKSNPSIRLYDFACIGKGRFYVPKLSARVLWGIVFCLIAIQASMTIFLIHRESLTFDEGNHSFAGYMMLHTGDYGLNPEHPPLVKFLAAMPTLGRNLWVPEFKYRDFKTEAYLDGGEWFARNDGDRNQLVFQMRLAAGILVPLFSLVVFLFARECFGDWAGLIALALIAFDPNVLSQSALVTTDIGVSFFFLAGTWCFYRYVKQPTWTRLIIAALVAGLLLATKHSGILLAPIMLLLIAFEVAAAQKSARARTALHLSGAFAFIVVTAVLVLWSFYGFRFAARPAGLQMSTTLADFVSSRGPHVSAVINGIAHLHLLPESYLFGMVDVARMADHYPTFIFGTNYPHGVWWYFPSVVLIKTSLGLLALSLLVVFAMTTRKLKCNRELAFVLIPALVYLLTAVVFGMNIGARHLLPFYGFLFIVAAAGGTALTRSSRRWAIVCIVFVAAHVVSALAVYPYPMAYANEAFGGPANVHNLLSDANVEWGEQLFEVKAWQDRHPNEECWFAYFVYPVINPETYGIRCHHLPNAGTGWAGGIELIPPAIDGTVLLSASNMVACEEPDSSLNPYLKFESMKPSETIGHGLMIFKGHFDMHQAAALARTQKASEALRSRDIPAALELAQEAVALDPALFTAQSTLGDALARAGRTSEARTAWQTALAEARKLPTATQTLFVPRLEAKLTK
jgi:4-amino-4-deoxy-L-arabinose transferase-like glycosyltransferase